MGRLAHTAAISSLRNERSSRVPKNAYSFSLVSQPGCYPDSTPVGKIERRLKVLYQGF